jgi:hypothetical protein
MSKDEELFAILPLSARCKAILEIAIAELGEQSPLAPAIEAVIQDLDELQIETTYQEAVTEGVVKTKGGAWIV